MFPFERWQLDWWREDVKRVVWRALLPVRYVLAYGMAVILVIAAATREAFNRSNNFD